MGPWYKSSKSLYKFATMNKAHRCEHCWLGIFQVYFWRMLELQCLNCSTKGTLLSPAVHEMLLTCDWLSKDVSKNLSGEGGRGVQTLMERAKKFFFTIFTRQVTGTHVFARILMWDESHRFETKGVYFLEPPSGSTTVEYPTGTLWQTWNLLCWLWQVFNCFAERQMN